jgi:hypothetical protein
MVETLGYAFLATSGHGLAWTAVMVAESGRKAVPPPEARFSAKIGRSSE